MFYGNNPMFSFNPTQTPTTPAFYPGFQTGYPSTFPMMNSYLPQWSGSQMLPQLPNALLPTDQTHLSQQMNLLCQQMAHLTEIVKTYAAMSNTLAFNQNRGISPMAQAMNPGFTFGMPSSIHGGTGYMNGWSSVTGGSMNPVGMSYEQSSTQVRETESFICIQIPFQNLNLGDVEVEVLGNRIICRTKAVIHPAQRFWHWNPQPQGIQFFELPDGRVECSCVIPVAFESKEVEAVFKDGSIAIYIPKAETNMRHSVKLGKETPQYVTATGSNRKATEMRA